MYSKWLWPTHVYNQAIQKKHTYSSFSSLSISVFLIVAMSILNEGRQQSSFS